MQIKSLTQENIRDYFIDHNLQVVKKTGWTRLVVWFNRGKFNKFAVFQAILAKQEASPDTLAAISAHFTKNMDPATKRRWHLVFSAHIPAVTEEALSGEQRWNRYLDRYCPGITQQRAQTWIDEGRALYQEIKSDTALPCSSTRKTQARAFTWFLMHRAVLNDSGYKEGTFILDDPDHKIAHFFEQTASRRLTSHFPGKLFSQGAYGIDVTQLPANHRTVHFGRVQTGDNTRQYTFLKPENYGTESWRDRLLHLLDYIRVKFCWLFGIETNPNNRTEHCPYELVQPFSDLHLALTGRIPTAKVPKFGVSAMRQFISELNVEQLNAQQAVQYRNFVQMLDFYAPDAHPARNGLEVIDTFSDLS